MACAYPEDAPEAMRGKESDLSKNKGMDNSANAMLFSEQLIEYVLKSLGYDWPCVVGARNFPPEEVSKRFSTVVGDAAVEIIHCNLDKIVSCYKQLVEKDLYSVDAFRVEVCVTATHFFALGYTPYRFVLFASMLAGISAFFMASGNAKIADVSAQFLSYIINYYTYQTYFNPDYDWFLMYRTAQFIRRQIKEKTVEFILPSPSEYF